MTSASPSALSSPPETRPGSAEFPPPELLGRLLRLGLKIGRLAYFERNLQTDEARWDAHMFRLFGLPPSDRAPGFVEAMQRVHPADRARTLAAWNHSVTHCCAAESYYRLVQPDGRTAAIHMVWDVLPDEHGRPWKAHGLALDASAAEMAHAQVDQLAQQLAMASALSRMGAWWHDVDTDLVFWDDASREMLGYADPMPVMTLDESRAFYIHPEDVERLRRSASELQEQSGPLTQEFRMRRGDGTYTPVASRRMVQTDKQGRIVRVCGMMLDLSREHEATRQRQTLLELLELVTGVTGVGLFHDDLMHGQSHWSAESYRLWGFERRTSPPGLQELLSRVHPDDVARVIDARQQAQRDPGVVELSCRVLHPGGGTRQLLTRHTVLRDALGHPTALVGVAVDVTEQQEAARRQAELLKRLQMATSITGMGLWEYALDDETLHWNEGMYRLMGQDPATSVQPASIWQQMVAEGRLPPDRGYPARGRAALGAGGLYEEELELTSPDGSTRWITMRTAVEREDDQRPVRLLGVAWDVTALRMAERERQEREAAERASQAKTEFLSHMSHELRTPLNAILGFAQVLRNDASQPLSGAQQRRVEQIESAGWHLLGLINEVLELSRIEAGALQVALADIDAMGVLREVADLVAGQAAQKQLHLSVPDSSWPLQVRADATRLKQVLLNLATNAVKYNHRPGGFVALEAQPCDRQGAWAGWVRLSVVDDGPGLDPTQQARLFRPFERLGRESGPIEGTGIGLVISRRLAELMGGRLEVDSHPGHGSRFSVLLPSSRLQG